MPGVCDGDEHRAQTSARGVRPLLQAQVADSIIASDSVGTVLFGHLNLKPHPSIEQSPLYHSSRSPR